MKLIKNTTPTVKTAHYRLVMQNDPEDIITKLRVLGESDSERDRRISRFLLNFLESKEEMFTVADWGNAFGVSKTVSGFDLRRALNIGLIRRLKGHPEGGVCFYTLCNSNRRDYRGRELTGKQKGIISSLYTRYGKEQFTNEECAAVIGKEVSTTYFHLHNLVERKIVSQRGKIGQQHQYALLITPETHPECFPKQETKKEMTSEFGSYPAVSVPMAAMAG